MSNSKSALKKIASKHINKWRIKNPIQSRLNGGILNHLQLEDLTVGGFENQILLLNDFEKEIKLVKNFDKEDEFFKKEILRSIKLKKYILKNDNPYKRSLNSYLKYITLVIYFHKENLNSHTVENIHRALVTASELKINVTLEDQKFAQDLIMYLMKIHVKDWRIKKQLDMCIKLLISISLNKEKKLFRPEIENINYLLTECYGTKNTLGSWRDDIQECLLEELTQLNKMEYPEINNNIVTIKEKEGLTKYIYDYIKKLYKKNHFEQDNSFDFDIELLPNIFSYITREGFYLHNKIEKKLLISNEMTKLYNVGKREFESFIYAFLSHEIYPGHHHHINSIKYKFIKEHLDFLTNPIGLEGWAVYSEQILNQLGFGYELKLNNLKKIIPVSIFFEMLLNGGKSAEKLIEKIFSSNKQLYNEFKRNKGFGSVNLVYVIGYIEYTKILKSNKRYDLNKVLSLGPLTPSYFKPLLDLQK
ncbi:hypothetical protein [Bacillus velezensis]|uniref:hypothetical protein n=1 Tax=Bacillus velezensis TaxID=492670 RepID=UPI0021B09533|nr:hypothetical protein [Bacillus velezensis]MCT6681050.1 hypothetical protein [Bacillus velezensis]WBY40809.1 hypothetical protein PF986_13605 [Bacillus velezensis]